MAEKKRLANMELLRIVAMMMVIVMHFLREAGVLPLKEAALSQAPLSATNLMAVFLEAFCIVAVNVYVLISGYFGTGRKWRLARVISFLCQIWFYALLIPLVLKLTGLPILPDTQGIYGWIQYVLPISSEHYWFATSYFYLLLWMPVLNLAVKAMSKRQLTVVLAALLFVFCGIKSICPIQLTMDKYGYDIIWFLCLYLLGAWLRSYGDAAIAYMRKKALPLYLASCFLIGILTVVLYQVTGSFSGTAYYYSVPFHYNFVFCLTGAVGLFFVFGNLSVKEGKGTDFIRKISKSCFGVYLLHEHLDLRHYWYSALIGIIDFPKGKIPGILVIELIICVVVIFTAGICIDLVRGLLFDRAAKWVQHMAFYQKVCQITKEKEAS